MNKILQCHRAEWKSVILFVVVLRHPKIKFHEWEDHCDVTLMYEALVFVKVHQKAGPHWIISRSLVGHNLVQLDFLPRNRRHHAFLANLG